MEREPDRAADAVRVRDRGVVSHVPEQPQHHGRHERQPPLDGRTQDEELRSHGGDGDQPDTPVGEGDGQARARRDVEAGLVAVQEHPDRDRRRHRDREVEQQREQHVELGGGEPHDRQRRERSQNRSHPAAEVEAQDDAERRVADQTRDPIRRIRGQPDSHEQRVEDPDRDEEQMTAVRRQVVAVVVERDDRPIIGEEGDVPAEPYRVAEEHRESRGQHAVGEAQRSLA